MNHKKCGHGRAFNQACETANARVKQIAEDVFSTPCPKFTTIDVCVHFWTPCKWETYEEMDTRRSANTIKRITKVMCLKCLKTQTTKT